MATWERRTSVPSSTVYFHHQREVTLSLLADVLQIEEIRADLDDARDSPGSDIPHALPASIFSCPHADDLTSILQWLPSRAECDRLVPLYFNAKFIYTTLVTLMTYHYLHLIITAYPHCFVCKT